MNNHWNCHMKPGQNDKGSSSLACADCISRLRELRVCSLAGWETSQFSAKRNRLSRRGSKSSIRASKSSIRASKSSTRAACTKSSKALRRQLGINKIDSISASGGGAIIAAMTTPTFQELKSVVFQKFKAPARFLPSCISCI